MVKQEVFQGFDFEELWIVNEYATYPYPQLKNNPQDLRE